MLIPKLSLSVLLGCSIAPLVTASPFQQHGSARKQEPNAGVQHGRPNAVNTKSNSNTNSISNVHGSSSSSASPLAPSSSSILVHSSSSSIAHVATSSPVSSFTTDSKTSTSSSSSTYSTKSSSASLLTGNSKASTSSSSYTFNPNSTENVAVYYGKIDSTLSKNLTDQCDNADIDIVLLAFVTDIIGTGGYPDLAFGTLCTAATSAQKAAGATGLMNCSSLGSQISHCHSVGKKVFVSIGGANGNTTFSSSSAAIAAANMVWNIFGGGSEDSTLRPFGSVVVDGFDIDNESGSSAYYTDFVTKLRALTDAQTSQTYYLSASTTCSYSSSSVSLAFLNLLDFVWPQFYGAPSCNLGTANFLPSFSAWSARLSGPRVYIGAPAWSGGTTNGGYENASAWATTIEQAAKNVTANKNFGGVTLWDGIYGELNVDSAGDDYITVSKTALEK